jgi:hypothetical protein
MPKSKKDGYYSDQELDHIRFKIHNTADRAIVELILEKGWKISQLVKLHWNDVKYFPIDKGIIVRVNEKWHILFESSRRVLTWMEAYPGKMWKESKNPPFFVVKYHGNYRPIDIENTSKRINNIGEHTFSLTTHRKPPFDTIYKGLLATHAYYAQHPREYNFCPSCFFPINRSDLICGVCSQIVDQEWRKVLQKRVDRLHEHAASFREVYPSLMQIYRAWTGIECFVTFAGKFVDRFGDILQNGDIMIPGRDDLINEWNDAREMLGSVKQHGPVLGKLLESVLVTEKEFDSLTLSMMREQFEQVANDIHEDVKKYLQERGMMPYQSG